MGREKITRKDDSIGSVVLPYVKGVTEQCQRVLKSYNISSAAKPVKTLRNILVHPKDKRSTEDCTGVVYSVPCANCDYVYIGESGRRLGTRLSEHRKEVDSESTHHYTRSQSRASVSVVHKSAITDHAIQNNHVIDWENATILDNDNNRHSRWIRESIYIRKHHHHCMNRDCGQYHLDTAYNPILSRRTPDVSHHGHDVTTHRDVVVPQL